MMQRKLFLLFPLSAVNWGLLMEFIPPICLHLCENIYVHVELITRRSIMHHTIGIPDNLLIDVRNIPIMRILN